MRTRTTIKQGRAVFNHLNRRISPVFLYRSKEYLAWSVQVRRSVRSGMAQLSIQSVQVQ